MDATDKAQHGNKQHKGPLTRFSNRFAWDDGKQMGDLYRRQTMMRSLAA